MAEERPARMAERGGAMLPPTLPGSTVVAPAHYARLGGLMLVWVAHLWTAPLCLWPLIDSFSGVGPVAHAGVFLPFLAYGCVVLAMAMRAPHAWKAARIVSHVALWLSALLVGIATWMGCIVGTAMALVLVTPFVLAHVAVLAAIPRAVEAAGVDAEGVCNDGWYLPRRIGEGVLPVQAPPTAVDARTALAEEAAVVFALRAVARVLDLTALPLLPLAIATAWPWGAPVTVLATSVCVVAFWGVEFTSARHMADRRATWIAHINPSRGLVIAVPAVLVLLCAAQVIHGHIEGSLVEWPGTLVMAVVLALPALLTHGLVLLLTRVLLGRMRRGE